jgi:hypothetical protein
MNFFVKKNHTLIYLRPYPIEKFLAGTMFKLELMDKFRLNQQGGVESSVEEEVRDAWTSFLADFCTLVSYEWHEYLNNVVNIESASFLGNLTTSDEAFAEWTIRCKFQETFAGAEEIKKHGKEEWMNSRKKRKRGPHDSREKMDVYSKLYHTILEHRKNRVTHLVWQQMFFEKYLTDHAITNNANDELEDDLNLSNYSIRMPSLDGELDGFDDLPVIPFSV